MSDKITVYQKPTCTTCRQVDQILRESGVDYDNINYYVDKLSEPQIKSLLKKMGISARELLRTKDASYKELNLGASEHSEAELVKMMAENPDLIQRPIVERGDKAMLGRPAETIKAFLQSK